MSKHIMEFGISNIRSQKDAKARVWKNEHGTAIMATVVDDVEGIPFAVDSYDVPKIIRMNADSNADALIEEYNKLPVSV